MMSPAEFSVGKFLVDPKLSGLVKSIMSKESEVTRTRYVVLTHTHARMFTEKNVLHAKYVILLL